MESMIMFLTHILKMLDYIVTGDLQIIPLEQLPGAVLEWIQYIVKLIHIYITIL